MLNPAHNIIWEHETKWVRAIALLMLSQLVGCARVDWPTDAQRKASFEPYRTLMVAGQPMSEFITERTAVLVSSDSIEIDRAANSKNSIRFQSKSNQQSLNLDQSLATAIDSRGYFLTAYHCIRDTSKSVIIFRCKGKEKMATPRVVACLPDLDLVILAIDAPLSSAFEWASPESLKPGETLLACGAEDVQFQGKTLTVHRRCLAGVMKEISPASEGLAVKHNVPICIGDSGGPTLNVEGKLVGIIARIVFRSFADPEKIAFRPYPEVVSRLIEADNANHLPKLK